MDKVKVQKTELVAALTKNRDQHAKDYKEALGGYYMQAEKEFEAKLVKIKAGEKFSTYFKDLAKPQYHIKEYNDVIDMLGVSSDETVYISMEDYLKYYKNEWDWQASWSLSNSGYATLYNTPGVGKATPKELQ